MHEALFANHPRLSLPAIFAIARGLSLPEAQLHQALEAGTYVDKVRADFLAASAAA